MHTNAPDIPWRKMILTLLAVAVWVSLPVIGYVTAMGEPDLQQCPNGAMVADLTGAGATTGKSPTATAQYHGKNNNGLTVKVKGANTSAGDLTVYIGDTSVGTINSKNGELRVDTVAADVTEGSTITVRNGTGTILTGTFRCAGGNGGSSGSAARNTNSGRSTNRNSGGSTNSNSNTNGNMNSNMNMNSNSSTNANGNANTTGTPRP
jgi:hypothetical protein